MNPTPTRSPNALHRPPAIVSTRVHDTDPAKPRWAIPALAASALLAALTLTPALSAAAAPLVSPNERQELGYPLLAAPIGLIMVLIATRLALRTNRPWSALLAATGMAWVANGFLVALRSWGVNGHLPHLPFVVATWLEQWFYVLPDVATFVLLPLALPTGRITGRWRIAVGAVAACGVVQMLCGAFGNGRMDDTILTNPIGIGSLHGLIGVRDQLYLPTILGGVLLVLVRAFLVRGAEPIRFAVVLALTEVSLLVATVLETILQGDRVLGWIPWTPVIVAVLGSAVLWARVAARSTETRVARPFRPITDRSSS